MEIRIILQVLHTSKQDEIRGDFSFLRRAIAHGDASLIIVEGYLKGDLVLFRSVNGDLRLPFLLLDSTNRERRKGFDDGDVFFED